MIRGLLGACIFTTSLLGPTVVAAHAQQASNSDVLQAIQGLREQVDRLVTRQEFDAATATLREHDTQIQQLKSELAQVTDVLRQQLAEQEQILRAISRSDSRGKNILALSAIMDESPEFQREMSTAVNRSINRRGHLIVENLMDSGYYVTVNRTDHFIPARDRREIEVPVGTVTTQIVGEQMKTWTVGAPTYEQRIQITPQPVSAFQPIGYDPWSFLSY